MKKILLSLLSLLALTVSAQKEVTLDFTDGVNTWGLPDGNNNKVTNPTTFSNGTYQITVQGANGCYWLKSNKTLLIGKQDASITLPVMDFKVGSVEVVCSPNGGASVTTNLFVGDNAVSTEATGCKGDFVFVVDASAQTAGTVYTIKVTNNNNFQFQKIVLKEVGSVVKKAAELKFNPTSVTVYTDKLSEFVAPTLSKATDAPLTWSTTREEVATVDVNGNVTLTGVAGSATIKVEAEETDNYLAGVATYSITVKEPEVVTTTDIAGTYELKNNDLLTLGAFDVVYVNGAYVFIKDNSGSGLIYKANYGLNAGDHVAAGLNGKISVYNNLYEIVPSSAVTDLSVTPGTAPQPVVATVAPSKDNVNQYVVYKGVTFAEDCEFEAGKESNLAGTWNGNEISFRNKFKDGKQFKAGTKYDIVAANSVFKEDIQVFFISATEATTGINTVAVESSDAAIYNLAGQRVGNNYKGAVIKGGKKYIVK